MKKIIEMYGYEIYQTKKEGQYIMIDNLGEVIMCFHKNKKCVFLVTVCDGYTFANHETYKELIDRV